MKKIIFLFLISISIGFSQEVKRKLVWQENFNGKKLSEKNWNFDIGDGCPNLCGWGNNEKQIYTNTNHQLKKGKLIITAQKKDAIYTSTKITTLGKKEFLYGRIEVRAKLPIGKGIWPAFWMLGANIKQIGWPKCGEIDILEYVGKQPHTIYTSLHTQESHGQTVNTKVTTIPKIEEGYHNYAIDWTKDKIEFFVDSISVYTYQPVQKNDDNWPFNSKQYIILDLAVGGNFGGPQVDDTIFPQQFIIDYIKVYQ
jgi:beta-glucanase (GH16 family)